MIIRRRPGRVIYNNFQNWRRRVAAFPYNNPATTAVVAGSSIGGGFVASVYGAEKSVKSYLGKRKADCSLPRYKRRKFCHHKKIEDIEEKEDRDHKEKRLMARTRRVGRRRAGRRPRRFTRKRRTFKRRLMRPKFVKRSRTAQLYKVSTAGTIAPGINQCKYQAYSVGSNTTLNTIFTAGLPIRTNTGAETVNMVTAAYGTQIVVRNASIITKIRNNDQVDVQIWCYECVPKEEGNDDPVTAITQGLDDLQGADSGGETSINFYPTHSAYFSNTYTIKSSKTWIMKPGDQVNFRVDTGRFIWTPLDNDQSEAYFRYTRWCLVRVQGTIAHDSTTVTTVGYTSCQVDVVVEASYEWEPIRDSPFVRRFTTVESGLGSITTPAQGNFAMEIENT